MCTFHSLKMWQLGWAVLFLFLHLVHSVPRENSLQKVIDETDAFFFFLFTYNLWGLFSKDVLFVSLKIRQLHLNIADRLTMST